MRSYRVSPANEPGNLAEQDEILFLALHGVRHRFDRLSLVLDLALALELYSTHGLHRFAAESQGWPAAVGSRSGNCHGA